MMLLFALFQLWFALANGFSGQILFDKWCIGIYNVVSNLFSVQTCSYNSWKNEIEFFVCR